MGLAIYALGETKPVPISLINKLQDKPMHTNDHQKALTFVLVIFSCIAMFTILFIVRHTTENTPEIGEPAEIEMYSALRATIYVHEYMSKAIASDWPSDKDTRPLLNERHLYPVLQLAMTKTGLTNEYQAAIADDSLTEKELSTLLKRAEEISWPLASKEIGKIMERYKRQHEQD